MSTTSRIMVDQEELFRLCRSLRKVARSDALDKLGLNASDRYLIAVAWNGCLDAIEAAIEKMPVRTVIRGVVEQSR